MTPLVQKQVKIREQQKKLFKELDKGIDDMENGKTIPHDDAMKLIRERIKSYAI